VARIREGCKNQNSEPPRNAGFSSITPDPFSPSRALKNMRILEVAGNYYNHLTHEPPINYGTVYTDPMEWDTDGDLLSDGDEYSHLTNPTDGDTDGEGLTDQEEIIIHLTNPIVADSDGDGVNDHVEIDGGMNPWVQDTDGDGLTDGQEMYQWYGMGSSDPLDPNTDAAGESYIWVGATWYEGGFRVNGIESNPSGTQLVIWINGVSYTYGPHYLTDYEEYCGYAERNNWGYYFSGGSDASQHHTDQDGLPDVWEAFGMPGSSSRSGSTPWVADSKPRYMDSDSDYLPDNVEVVDLFESQNFFCSDPMGWDTDGDDISDHDEFHGHNSHSWVSYPRRSDSDGDGLGDHYEIHEHTKIYNGVTYHWYSDPMDTDTDDDGLSDYDENYGKNLYGDSYPDRWSDPQLPDSDYDGFGDKMEMDLWSLLDGLIANSNPTIISKKLDTSPQWTAYTGTKHGSENNLVADDGNNAGSDGTCWWNNVWIYSYWGYLSDFNVGTYRSKINDIHIVFDVYAEKSGGNLHNIDYYIKTAAGTVYTATVKTSPASGQVYPIDVSLPAAVITYVKGGGYIKEVGVRLYCGGLGWYAFHIWADYMWIRYELFP
jgi:hypothetical protein